MDAALRTLLNGRPMLIAVAADIEAKAIANGLGITLAGGAPQWQLLPLAPNVELVITGVGKASAAGGLARVLDPSRHACVLNTGIAGAYPPTPLGTVVCATACVFADEGVLTPEGFEDIASMGFPPTPQGMAVPVPIPVLQMLSAHANAAGPITTVSLCSGTDALALQHQTRTNAIAEAMEGAAIALVASRLGVPFGELRAISNTTGDRAAQVWRIKDALSTLSRVIGSLLGPV